MQPTVSLIIPAYNEERNIRLVIQQACIFFKERSLLYEIIVVDDGSTDRTTDEILRAYSTDPSIQLISLEKNYGKGYAVKTGILRAQGDIVVFSDADGSTPIEELDNFLTTLKEGIDILIGSRYIHTSIIRIRQPWYRVLLGRFGNILIQKVLLPGIMDTQCGFKVMRRDAARTVFSRQTIHRWGFDMELLVIAKLHGLTIQELPVRWHDTTNRTSRFRPIRDAHRTLGDLIRIKRNLKRGVYR